MNKIKDNPAELTNESYKNELLKMFKPQNEVLETHKYEETKPIDEISKKWNMNDRIINLFASNIERDQKLKEKYAIILIVILAIELVALLIIFILKGCNVLQYSDSTFNIFITGGIAEIFVLVRVIVKYLFKDNLTNALNIILRYNNQTKNMKRSNSNNKNDKKELAN